MNNPPREHDFSDVQTEINALRQEVRDLNARLNGMAPASSSPKRWRLPTIARFAVLAALMLAALFVGVAAPGGNDAFTISPQGYVGINQRMPKVPLDVNGNAAVSGALTAGTAAVSGELKTGNAVIGGALKSEGAIYAANSDLYFTNTDHAHSTLGNVEGNAAIENAKNYGALMILGRQGEKKFRTVSLWDNVGIGTAKPLAPLDVKGEMRGKLWYSETFTWSKGQAEKRMTKSDHSACFLTLISGYFYGGGEIVHTYVANGYWYLGGAAEARDVRAEAVCIGAPDSSW